MDLFLRIYTRGFILIFGAGATLLAMVTAGSRAVIADTVYRWLDVWFLSILQTL